MNDKEIIEAYRTIIDGQAIMINMLMGIIKAQEDKSLMEIIKTQEDRLAKASKEVFPRTSEGDGPY